MGDDQTDLLTAFRAMYRGMLEPDTDMLDDLLDDGYTLTHMTGHLQSKKEWLEQVASGEMRYLQLSNAYERRDGAWTTMRTVATTF